MAAVDAMHGEVINSSATLPPGQEHARWCHLTARGASGAPTPMYAQVLVKRPCGVVCGCFGVLAVVMVAMALPVRGVSKNGTILHSSNTTRRTGNAVWHCHSSLRFRLQYRCPTGSGTSDAAGTRTRGAAGTASASGTSTGTGTGTGSTGTSTDTGTGRHCDGHTVHRHASTRAVRGTAQLAGGTWWWWWWRHIRVTTGTIT